MPTLSIPGVGSNLDVTSLVSQLMAVEAKPLSLLTTAAQTTQTRLSAFAQLKGLLATFQTSMAGISADRFNAVKASVANSAVATVSASNGAAAGTHSIEVSNLAAAQRLKSPPFAALDTTVGTGTLTFEFGAWNGTTFAANSAKPARSVAIAAGQNTVSGIRDAINAAGIGVTAAVVNDGTAQRLVFTSNDTGLASSMRVSVADDGGGNTDMTGLSQLAYDPAALAQAGKNLTQITPPADASFLLDGIQVTSASNVTSDALQGVTISLAAGATATATTFTLARDSSAIQSAVSTFVNAWNDVHKTLASLTSYDPVSKKAGTLQGDSVAQSIGAGLVRVLGTASPTVGGTVRSLSQAGVTMGKDGTLSLDTAKLQSAIANAPDDLAKLFAVVGKSDDVRLTYMGSSDKTAAGSYGVVVSQPATHGTLTGSAAAPLTVVAGVNDVLSVVVDGVAATATLAAGDYANADALAAQIQSKLNGANELVQAGISVSVSQTAGVLAIQSASYGAASTVATPTGSAAAAFLGSDPVSAAGQDVAGTLDGNPATGLGQFLTGTAGSPSEGLRLRVNATSAGSYGTLTFGRGYADLLKSAATSYIATSGGIASRVDGLNASLKANQARQDEMNKRLTATEARLRAQFTALDSLMSSMNRTSTFLTQQLANLPNSTSNSKN